MSLIEDEFGSALRDPVKRKGNNTGKLRHKAAKVSSGVPETMVKITGFVKGAAHVKAHLTYITRNGEVEMENERGEIFKGKDEVKMLFKDWAASFEDHKRHKNQRDTMHMVLSMPEHVDSVSVHQAVREFAKKTFGKNHEYVFALHTDEPHPHCHVTVKCRGFNGKQLNPRKDDLQAWREGFAEALQLQGVEATASPRRSRGVVKKAEKSVIRHIERGDERTPPRVPRVKALQYREIGLEIEAETHGKPVGPHPWEEQIAARQKAVRAAWLSAADALNQPKPPVVFKKEIRNEQPRYDQLDAAAFRSIQLSAGVYQSGFKAPRSQKPAAALSSLRNLSGLPLVQSQRSIEMLLHANARVDLGHDGRRAARAGDGVRRPGDRVDGVGSSDRSGDERSLDRLSSTQLAARLKSFVQALPSVETARDEIKRKLLAEVQRRKQEQGLQNKVVAPKVAQPRAVPREPSRDRDLDR